MLKDQDILPGEPTEYYDIAKDNPELKGDLVGEIINDNGKPSLHLRVPGKGQILTQQGQGDIVVMDISRDGWSEILNTVEALGPEASIQDVKRKLVETDFLTEVKPVTQR